MDKHRKNTGQQLIPEIERTAPRGMPSLAMIETEVKRLGFWKRDAEDIYDRWLANGFRTKVGPIRDWRAAIRVMIRNKWLPSQRVDAPGLVRHKEYKPAQLKEAAADRREYDQRRALEARTEALKDSEGKDSWMPSQEAQRRLRQWRQDNRPF